MTLRLDEDDRYWHTNQQETSKWFQFEPPLRYVLFVIGVISFIVGLWYFLTPSSMDDKTNHLPLIRAEELPLKKKIENMTVASVKHQDKLVYQRLTGDEEKESVEHILPDSGASVTHMHEDAKKDQDQPIKMVQQYVDDGHEMGQQSEKTDDAKAEKENQKEITMDDLLEEAGDEVKESIKVSVNQGKSIIMLQLGSLKSPDHAENEWNRLLKKCPQELEKIKHKITRVDLGQSKGVYYRLRIGPFENIEKARFISDRLKEKKIESVVIHEES